MEGERCVVNGVKGSRSEGIIRGVIFFLEWADYVWWAEGLSDGLWIWQLGLVKDRVRLVLFITSLKITRTIHVLN